MRYYRWNIINHVRPRIIKASPEIEVEDGITDTGRYYLLGEGQFGLAAFIVEETKWNRNKYGYVTETQKMNVERTLRDNMALLHKL